MTKPIEDYIYQEYAGKSLRVDTDSSTIIYLGIAPFGSLDSDAVWNIKRIDLSSGVSITNASEDFDKIWNNRLVLTYV